MTLTGVESEDVRLIMVGGKGGVGKTTSASAIALHLVRDLRENGLPVNDLVINYIVKDADCDFHVRRRTMQEKYIRSLEETYGQMNIVKLYLSPYEIRGIERIREIAERLFG